jgi:chromosomal replication initiation ATPase DnaA
MSQLSFDFPFQDNYLTDDFLTASANLAAFNFVTDFDIHNPDLPKIFAVCGAEASGKTHLAHIWQRKTAANFFDAKKLENLNLINHIKPSRAYIIEDIDKISNQAILLHIFNIAASKGAYLMITSGIELGQIKYQFADLASRLKNIFCLQIKNPDDELIKILLMKNFSALQLAVKEPVINYLAGKIERSFMAIEQVTKLLKFYCFEEKREITIPLANKVLEIIKNEAPRQI